MLAGDIRMPRVAARVEPLGIVTRVTVDVAPATPHSVAQDGTRLLVRFEADALDTGDLRVPAPTDTLQADSPRRRAADLAIDLGPRFASFRAPINPAPAGGGRIVIDLIAHDRGGSGAGHAAARARRRTPPGETPPLLDLPPAGGPAHDRDRRRVMAVRTTARAARRERSRRTSPWRWRDV